MTITVAEWGSGPGSDLQGGTDIVRRRRMISISKPSTPSAAKQQRRIAIVSKQVVHLHDSVEVDPGSSRHVKIVHLADSLEALRKQRIRIEVVVLDLTLEDIACATAAISTIAPLYPVLVVSASARRDDMMAAIHAGTSGYVTGNARSDAIIGAVETIASGGRYLSAQVSGAIGVDASRGQSARPAVALSNREKEVLLYISHGLTQAQTARRMGVSSATVDTYVKRIRRKVGPGNKADLTRQAITLGYLDATSIQEFGSALHGTVVPEPDCGEFRVPTLLARAGVRPSTSW